MSETVICVNYSATFSKGFCAQSHQKANSAEGIAAMYRTKCRRCPIGAESLGSDKYIERSVFFKSKICARCGRQSDRLVNGYRCVSCFNRERENHRGLNKRGRPLYLIRAYYPAVVTFMTLNGEIREVEFKKVLHEDEARRSAQLTQHDLVEILKITLLSQCTSGVCLGRAPESRKEQ